MALFSMIKILLLCAASLTALLLATPASAQTYNHLLSGERLSTGQSLRLGNYQFIIQNDCNLVLYDSGKPIWATNTGGLASRCYLAMQTDGNLVVYDNGNKAIWASNTNGANGNYILVLQKDRNVVIYSRPLWATGTNQYGSAIVIAAAANGTVAASGAEQNRVKEMLAKIVQVVGDE